jgi:hypothetical protein
MIWIEEYFHRLYGSEGFFIFILTKSPGDVIIEPIISNQEEANTLLGKLQQFYKYIEENFEEVGTHFTKEALKIHYGVPDKRNIR